jgi:hypothetical protein
VYWDHKKVVTSSHFAVVTQLSHVVSVAGCRGIHKKRNADIMQDLKRYSTQERKKGIPQNFFEQNANLTNSSEDIQLSP